jgi:RNA polymerase sigma factor (sigma-70 family)
MELSGRLLDVIMRPFEEIVAEHGPVVMRVCRALLGPVDAQDAWSETFLSAMRAYPDLRPDSRVRGWLVTIAHRKAIDQIRKTSRNPRPTGRLPEVPVEDHLPDRGDDGLRAALEALPPKQRGAVIYRYLADLPYAEVGALLESSEAAARRSAADGIAGLRKTYTKGPER